MYNETIKITTIQNSGLVLVTQVLTTLKDQCFLQSFKDLNQIECK